MKIARLEVTRECKTMSENRKVRLWQIAATDKAYQFSSTPQHGRDGDKHWIPRSLIRHISRSPAKDEGWPECIVEMEEWKADQLGL